MVGLIATYCSRSATSSRALMFIDPRWRDNNAPVVHRERGRPDDRGVTESVR